MNQRTVASTGRLEAGELSGARILILDDQPDNVALLEQILHRAGYSNIVGILDSRLVLEEFERGADILLLDLMMPHFNGFQVMEMIYPLVPEGSFFPILVLTADQTRETKLRALDNGATDFLIKPLDLLEVAQRVGILLQSRFLHLETEAQKEQLRDHNRLLEQRVKERTAQLLESQQEVLERLAQACEFRDDSTGHHTRRVSALAGEVSRRLGQSDELVETIRRSAPLHDVGKIAIPDSILLKPGKLTDPEMEVMKTHSALGASMLAGGKFSQMEMAARIALTHHERWDGTGYPTGLSGDEIPLEGRIVAVVDVFDALVHERPYKEPWPMHLALEEISRLSGRHFDPQVASAFLEIAPIGEYSASLSPVAGE